MIKTFVETMEAKAGTVDDERAGDYLERGILTLGYTLESLLIIGNITVKVELQTKQRFLSLFLDTLYEDRGAYTLRLWEQVT